MEKVVAQWRISFRIGRIRDGFGKKIQVYDLRRHYNVGGIISHG
jgi:hypothetical protein